MRKSVHVCVCVCVRVFVLVDGSITVEVRSEEHTV